MKQYSKLITALISVVSFILIHTACKPCHGMMAMPCERSTGIAGIVLAVILLSDILSFLVKQEKFRQITSVINVLFGVLLLLTPIFGQCQVASMACRLRTFPTLNVSGLLIAGVSLAALISVLVKRQTGRKTHAHA